MRPKVFITRKLPEEAIELLKKECEVEVNQEDRPLTKQEIIQKIKDKDALLCLLTDEIDKEVIESNPKLKIIANYAVGYNNIDIETATKHGIFVTNTPGVLTETTADLTWALILSVARRIIEADKFLRDGKFKSWEPMLLLGEDVYGKTLGIIGFGRIGRAVAKRAKGFDMKIIYYDITRAPEEVEKELNAKFVDLETLLKEADIISLHTPLTKETTHLISEKEFNLMKRTAILINTSRGPVVDENALVNALKSRKILAAGLDVYEEEPKVHPELLRLNNVVILPHIGSASIQTRTKMALMAAENILSVFRGEKPPNLVNTELWK